MSTITLGLVLAIVMLDRENLRPLSEFSYLSIFSASWLIDGDTGWQNGVKWRLLDVDTPELHSPDCAREYKLAVEAKNRLRQLMSEGYKVEWSNVRGRYGRELVRIRLASGRDAGSTLLSEGLAQPWPHRGNIWCGR